MLLPRCWATAADSSLLPDRLRRGFHSQAMRLTFGESAVILLSSGFSDVWRKTVLRRWLADKIGRRKVFLMTDVNFSIATGIMTFYARQRLGFPFVFRFLISGSSGGVCTAWTFLWCRNSCRLQSAAWSVLITAAVPIGVLMGAALGACAAYVGWRGLFADPGWFLGLTLLIAPGCLDIAGRSVGGSRKPGNRWHGPWKWTLRACKDPVGVPEGWKALSRLSDIFRGTRGASRSRGSLNLGRCTRRAIMGSCSGFDRLLDAAIGRHARAGVLPADLCQFCRPVRAHRLVVSFGRDWPKGVRARSPVLARRF